ncbi:hypothetical protein RRG08_024424 [Elysia crispata]|uniref:Uncharacterized protein n=1 Tax=Elysia crispata TaxID=231223 RepID=A0AAE0YQA6_9GAST|nr:hypothetical protein RRG08_024424 [Elysia crispata]
MLNRLVGDRTCETNCILGVLGCNTYVFNNKDMRRKVKALDTFPGFLKAPGFSLRSARLRGHLKRIGTGSTQCTAAPQLGKRAGGSSYSPHLASQHASASLSRGHVSGGPNFLSRQSGVHLSPLLHPISPASVPGSVF